MFSLLKQFEAEVELKWLALGCHNVSLAYREGKVLILVQIPLASAWHLSAQYLVNQWFDSYQIFMYTEPKKKLSQSRS